MVARRPTIVGYFAGHTHRNRVRLLADHRRRAVRRGRLREGLPRHVGRVPGVRGRHPPGRTTASRRPTALAWSERCRDLYADFGVDYVAYALGPLRPLLRVRRSVSEGKPPLGGLRVIDL